MTCILDIPEHLLTPGMKQYREAKEANPDCLIMLRMGDFYEMFYKDAVDAARDLDITLTKRGKGEKCAPLAGIPYHAIEPYLGRLVKKGHKVAIIEQLEDPKQAKGLVKRGLVRIVTAGTLIESSLLDAKKNNYLLALTSYNNGFAYSLADLSTGEFVCGDLNNEQSLLAEIERRKVAECILPQSLMVNQDLVTNIKKLGTIINSYDDYYFKKERAEKTLKTHFNVPSLESFGIESDQINQEKQVSVSGALLNYLLETQKNSLSHFKFIKRINNSEIMQLDRSTLLNLELVENLRDRSKRGSLLSIIDHTTTSMGARLIKQIIKEPLLNKQKIISRHNAITELNEQVIAREDLKILLKEIYDLERLIARVNYGNANPKDLISLKQSLEKLPEIKLILSQLNSQLLQTISGFETFQSLHEILHVSIREEPPTTIREGGVIKPNFNPELDSLLEIKTNSKHYLQEIERKEKEKTKISSLKISFNRVFGYYLEVTRKNAHLVPDHYIRKQTLANAERYITEELKVEEEKILGAEEKIKVLEFDLFQKIIQQIKGYTVPLQKTAKSLALLDVLISFSVISMDNNYSQPVFNDNNTFEVIKGRHPVIEQIENNFIPNDTIINNGEIMIITGPNTSGKSTIMRQTALISLMAQIGCFVPAESANLSIVDRIFTRVGAHDDLSSGQSTFMVEMLETANILNNATSKSLIILDEIGRGTSTFDGVSIAWSTAEHIYNQVKAKTMFATHYHVLNKMEKKFEKINNYNVAVKDINGEIIFLRKLVKGGTDQSHGVHVAKLAGMPKSVVERAKEIQKILESEDEMVKKIKEKKVKEQLSLENFNDQD